MNSHKANSGLEITDYHLLLVEGDEEINFFEALLKHLGIASVQIISVQGKKNFARHLQTLLKLSNFDDVQSIGLVRDADGNPKGEFDSLCSALKKADLPVPRQVLTSAGNHPRITTLLMPPNDEGSGRMLEDLCLASVSDDPAMLCVDRYFECLADEKINLRENVMPKARVHAFLASRKEPDRRLGEAARAGYWDFDSPVFEPVKEFLRQVVIGPDKT